MWLWYTSGPRMDSPGPRWTTKLRSRNGFDHRLAEQPDHEPGASCPPRPRKAVGIKGRRRSRCSPRAAAGGGRIEGPGVGILRSRYNRPRLWDPSWLWEAVMAPRIKYAAVGCGGMGRRHLRGMAALYGSSRCNMELVAACDLKPEQVNLYADEAEQLLGTRPRVFTDIAEM